MSRCVVFSVLLALVSIASIAVADTASPLIAAVKANNVAAVQTLIKQRVNVNAAEADGTTALHWAARADHLELVRTLLRAAAIPSSRRRRVR